MIKEVLRLNNEALSLIKEVLTLVNETLRLKDEQDLRTDATHGKGAKPSLVST